MIIRIHDFADNMLEKRMESDYVRSCGYVPEVEEKLKRKYPETFAKYEKAKERWFREFDAIQDEIEEYYAENELKWIKQKQYRLEEMEKEIRIIKKDIGFQINNIENRLKRNVDK